MKILNLYGGIGGNRKNWGNDHDITTIENNQGIANIYKAHFPNDKIIVADAKDYLISNYDNFDFIWASPPCQSHSSIKVNFANATGSRRREPTLPDMTLYQIIIFLSGFFKGKYVVENVNPYYTPLIPAQKLGRHLFWCNFKIGNFEIESDNILRGNAREKAKELGYNFNGFKGQFRKDQIVNNMVNPELGSFILDCAMNVRRKENIKQTELF